MVAKAKAKKESTFDISDLASLQREVSRQFGGQVFFGDAEELKLIKLPLGILPFDQALGGGFAFNRMVLLEGEESAGKTLLALLTVLALQRQYPEANCVWFDIEKVWTKEWAEKLGIDTSRLTVIHPDTAEKAFDAALVLVKKGIALLVFDSLAAIVSSAELEPDADKIMERQSMGGSAQLIGRALKLLNNANHGTLLLFINQFRQKVGVVFGNPETTPGGKAPGYYAWQRVRVKKGKVILDGEIPIGYEMIIQVSKNKQGVPWLTASTPFMFAGYVDGVAGLVELCEELKVIEHSGNTYSFYITDESTGEQTEFKAVGKKKFTDRLKAEPEALAALEKLYNELPEED